MFGSLLHLTRVYITIMYLKKGDNNSTCIITLDVVGGWGARDLLVVITCVWMGRGRQCISIVNSLTWGYSNLIYYSHSHKATSLKGTWNSQFQIIQGKKKENLEKFWGLIRDTEPKFEVYGFRIIVLLTMCLSSLTRSGEIK